MATLIAGKSHLIITSGLKFLVVDKSGLPLHVFRRSLRRAPRSRPIGDLEASAIPQFPPEFTPEFAKQDEVLKELEDEKRKLKKAKVKTFKKTEEAESEPTFVSIVREIKQSVSFENVTPDNQFDLLNRVITPFAQFSYDEQLQLMEKKNREVVRRLSHVVPSAKGCMCHPAVPSPVVKEYRNKDEFSVQVGIDGNPKTVGFFIGSPRTGVVCVEPRDVSCIKEEHKNVARVYQRYIRQSDLKANFMPGVKFSDGGHWRNIVVRSNMRGDLMAIVQFHPQDMTRERIEEEKSKLREYFETGGGRDAKLSSLFFQESPMVVSAGGTVPCERLFGASVIEETFSDRPFRFSPQAFFQINVPGAEEMVKLIRKFARLNKNTVLLDLCCGVGLYSVLFKDQVSFTIAIDYNEGAILDAKANFELNGVENAVLEAGRIEDVLHRHMGALEDNPDPVSVVINPARSGVNYEAVRQLRRCRHVKRIVYVSCQPEGEARQNFMDLCATHKKNKKRAEDLGKPFRMVHAVPVDLFPQTSHCEHLFVFSRS